MKYIRFQDPAGAIRKGIWGSEEDEVQFGDRSYSVDEVNLLAPCEPSKIVCVGLNYKDHAAELNKTPDRPRLFFKPPNTVAGPGDTVTLPADKRIVERNTRGAKKRAVAR